MLLFLKMLQSVTLTVILCSSLSLSLPMVFPRPCSMCDFLSAKLPVSVCEHFVAIQVNVLAINISYQSASPVLCPSLQVLPDEKECFLRAQNRYLLLIRLEMSLSFKFIEKNGLSKTLMFYLMDKELKGHLFDGI